MNNNFEKNNEVILKGTCYTDPEFSHSVMGEGFYEFILAVPRLSNEVDYLPITISERLLNSIGSLDRELGVVGQLRSYNKLIDGKSKLILTIFARELVDPQDLTTSNKITITGYVCKPTIYRTTPFGREITDMLIAVNRAYNKSDYLPCIAWGRNARFTGDLNVGDKVELSGRIQSREYIKKIDMDNAETKTAYEVSVSTVALLVKDEDEVSENEINKINIRSEYEYDEEEASVR